MPSRETETSSRRLTYMKVDSYKKANDLMAGVTNFSVSRYPEVTVDEKIRLGAGNRDWKTLSSCSLCSACSLFQRD